MLLYTTDVNYLIELYDDCAIEQVSYHYDVDPAEIRENLSEWAYELDQEIEELNQSNLSELLESLKEWDYENPGYLLTADIATWNEHYKGFDVLESIETVLDKTLYNPTYDDVSIHFTKGSIEFICTHHDGQNFFNLYPLNEFAFNEFEYFIISGCYDCDLNGEHAQMKECDLMKHLIIDHSAINDQNPLKFQNSKFWFTDSYIKTVF